MKLLLYVPEDGPPPLTEFLSSLDEKLRHKLATLFAMLKNTAFGQLREPYIKHFTIEKYAALYELRAKGNVLIRITFTLTPGGDILLLFPFIKRHKRNTMQALDASLRMLSQYHDGSGSVQELSIHHFLLEART